jgi:hypothetical protein
MQSFTQIQQAFDTALAAALVGVTVPGITSITTYLENDVSNFATQPDITTKLALRTNLIPAPTVVETLGTDGYVNVSGIYAIDIFGAVNQGYVPVQTLGDVLLAAFSRGTILTLTNGDQVTISTSSPSATVNQGAWLMNKLYCRQIMVKWFGYVQP